ncbi:MAG TPA: LppP/LprE family lipoprotein [Vicinamibacterales bacterium]|nr:LppP/LprE family lipoprotein [Vicinamibacterales bacterium]
MQSYVRSASLVFALAIVAIAASSPRAQSPAGWLDSPLAQWNQSVATLPAPSTGAESPSALACRCGSNAAKGPSADAVSKAGWVPFLHQDRPLVRDDLEVLGGMSSASAGCEASVFNLFVFAAGRYAGTIAPAAMTTARDGAVGTVRFTGADALTAEFARYTPGDTECCPSSRVRVTYRIDRSGGRPVLVATETRPIR